MLKNGDYSNIIILQSTMQMSISIAKGWKRKTAPVSITSAMAEAGSNDLEN